MTTGQSPIDMVLHCPECHEQHIDEEDWVAEWLRIKGVECTPDLTQPYGLRWSDGQHRPYPWVNRPHRSHLCHYCGHIWRPADVPTNGVLAVKTRGANDHPIKERTG